jgi:hypothetical protein
MSQQRGRPVFADSMGFCFEARRLIFGEAADVQFLLVV